MKPWPALDMLKCLCVLGMILLHCFYWTATDSGRLIVSPESWLFPWIMRFMFLGFLPLMLPLTAGCAHRLQLSPAIPPRWQLIVGMGSGLLLIGAGYLMNLLAAGWMVLEAWNVLQFVGVSFAVIHLLLALGGVPAVTVAGVACLLGHLAVLRYWPVGPRSFLTCILIGDPGGFHSWPFVPWFPTVVSGFLIANAFLKQSDTGRLTPVVAGIGSILLIAALAMGSWLPSLDVENVMAGGIFIPSFSFLFAIVGIACLALFSADRLLGDGALAPKSFVNCFSKGIFWIYLSHLVLGCRLNALLQTLTGKSAWVLSLSHTGRVLSAIILPAGLILFSWFVGYLVVRFGYETRVRIRVRPIEPPVR